MPDLTKLSLEELAEILLANPDAPLPGVPTDLAARAKALADEWGGGGGAPPPPSGPVPGR